MAKRTCSIDGCDRVHYARTWCHMHYKRWHIHGDPTISLVDRNANLTERFWAKVDKNGPIPAHAPELGACWTWTAGHTVDGYASFRHDKGRLAHRFAYTMFVGTIPTARVLDHLCRNRGCVNTHHLEPVTRRTNTQRGIVSERKARRPTPRSSLNPTSVYIAVTADHVPLYVGVTGTGLRRFHSHGNDSLWWPEASTLRLVHCETRDDALDLESFLIAYLDPAWNLSLGFGDVTKGRAIALHLGALDGTTAASA